MKKITLGSEIKGIIFDIDGTLVDTMPVHYKACQIVCNKHGFDFPLDYFYAKAGIPTLKVFEMLVKDLGLNLDGINLGREKEKVYLELIHEVKPLTLVHDIALNYYNKLPMALGTGGTRDVAEKTLIAAGVDHLFNILITADDVTKPKPDPETFLLCAEKMNIAPELCVVLEDGDPGLQAALAAGMKSIDVRQYL
ncbi:MAG: HAD family hydrolase [Cytophagaceae bacterium]